LPLEYVQICVYYNPHMDTQTRINVSAALACFLLQDRARKRPRDIQCHNVVCWSILA